MREAVAVPAGGRVDPADLAAALEHPDTKRRFVTIHSDDELAAMLEAPLEKWRVFLHPSQERLVGRSFNGPARVLGGAGTGKTVVAMHRARHLARKVFTAPSDRILLTTYTANLAENIEAALKTLCGPERERVEVVHLHAWAVRLLRSHGVGVRHRRPGGGRAGLAGGDRHDGASGTSTRRSCARSGRMWSRPAGSRTGTPT